MRGRNYKGNNLVVEYDLSCRYQGLARLYKLMQVQGSLWYAPISDSLHRERASGDLAVKALVARERIG